MRPTGFRYLQYIVLLAGVYFSIELILLQNVYNIRNIGSFFSMNTSISQNSRAKMIPFMTTTSITTMMTTPSTRSSSARPRSKGFKKFIPYLRYYQDFHKYPLDINLPRLVSEKRSHNNQMIITPIHNHKYSYIHTPQDCTFNVTGKRTRMAILVKSSADNFHLRAGIRETWGNIESIPVIFFLGSTNLRYQKHIDKEFENYGDIVQANFVDAYLNNTHKTIMTFNWASKHCSNADFFFFVDDDHYILVHNILSYIDKLQPQERSRLYLGYLLRHSKPIRDEDSKWYISFEEYPFERYPPYFAGGAFLVSLSIVQKFSLAFPYVKMIGIDDCYLGIVARKLNMTLTNSNYFHNRRKVSIFTENVRLFATHGFGDPEDMRKMYKDLTNCTLTDLLVWSP